MEQRNMNNEINTNKENTIKESGNHKTKWSMQNILAIIIIVPIVTAISIFAYTIYSSGAYRGGAASDGVGLELAILLFFAITVILVGTIITSVVVGVSSFINLAKNKEQLTLSEEKSKKRWYIFDVVSFLVVPITIVTIYIILGEVFGASLPFFVFVVLASGIKAIIRNKKSRIAGWLLIILGLSTLIVVAQSFYF